MEFRRATMDDIEVLVDRRMDMRAEREEAACHIAIGDFEESTRDYFLTHIPDARFIAWLAIEDNAVIATSGMCIYDVPPTYGNPSGKVAYLVNMYTVPEYRGQGIATKLLEHLITEARERGCGRVTLNTSKSGRSVYEKYGFVDLPGEMEYILD